VRLPPDVVWPFELRLVRDDLHVMAWFGGHSAYGAVEAMVRRGAGGRPAVRCIVTRHDQSQVDHVNEPELLRAARGSGRETCLREISFGEERTAAGPRAHLELESHAGERIELDVAAAGEPDSRFGGLSDPGRHSGGAVLPLMWRARSTLAGPGTRVSLDGKRFPATRGYYTRGHTLGALRSGVVELRLVSRPEPIAPGGEWIYERAGERAVYRISDGPANEERLRIERQDASGEWLLARLDAGRLHLLEAGVADGLGFAFGGDGRFAARVESAATAVTGSWAAEDDRVRLTPESPPWAREREVQVHFARTRDMLTLTTTIAPSRRGGDS
jgi:hypothetical protein